MAIDLTPNSLVFEELLSVNPWAREHWAVRQGMIAAGIWNINGVNQAGNEPTETWLKSFLVRRAAETQARFLGDDESHDRWNHAIHAIVAPVFADPMLASISPGTPQVLIRPSAAVVSRAGHVAGYFPGQFLADVLLLAQPSLRDSRPDRAIDLSGRLFAIGPDFRGAHFECGLAAAGAVFGPYADMSAASFRNASFSDATFHGPTSWALSTFKGYTGFARAHFLAWAGFDAAIFAGPVDFSMARFDEGAHFAGTMFSAECRLDGARFSGSTTFEYSQFADAPGLERTLFLSTASTVGVAKAVRDAIRAISRPSPSVYPN